MKLLLKRVSTMAPFIFLNSHKIIKPLNMTLRNYFLLIMSFIILSIVSSCKKNRDVVMQTASGSVDDKLKDTVVLDSKDVYLWYSQIPATFNGRNFADPNTIMGEIRQYSVEPGFPDPVDRWSFAVKQAEWDNISNGIGTDFFWSHALYQTR